MWAIDEAHEALYLFPRECPRILVWATPATTSADEDRWLGGARMAAYIERAWLERLRHASICRYHFPLASFEDLADAGMWVSRVAVEPLSMDRLADLPSQLKSRGVNLRVEESLAPLRPLWATSLRASGIRLRDAAGWPGAGGSDGL